MKVNAIFGVALLAMCATGLVIWWPGSKSWKDGLKVKRRVGWKRSTYDLHRATGFFVAGLLLVMAFTGFYFGFPLPVMTALAKLTGGDAAEVRQIFRRPKLSVIEGAKRVSLDGLVQDTSKLLPPGTELSSISVPTRPTGVFTVTGTRPGNPVLRGRAGAFVDQYSGQVLRSFDSREGSLGSQLVLMFGPIHFGLWGGIWSKALWFLLGFAPGTLFTTGFLMWWNRVAGKRYRAWQKSPFNTTAQMDRELPRTVIDEV